jgi:hypothetical protein
MNPGILFQLSLNPEAGGKLRQDLGPSLAPALSHAQVQANGAYGSPDAQLLLGTQTCTQLPPHSQLSLRMGNSSTTFPFSKSFSTTCSLTALTRPEFHSKRLSIYPGNTKSSARPTLTPNTELKGHQRQKVEESLCPSPPSTPRPIPGVSRHDDAGDTALPSNESQPYTPSTPRN